MQIPPPTPGAVRAFETLATLAKGCEVRKMFGQPVAFVGGQMAFGVYGSEVFFRLSESDQAVATERDGAHPFEPMPGRPMREYVILPPKILADPRKGPEWVARCSAYTASRPKKPSKKSAKSSPRPRKT